MEEEIIEPDNQNIESEPFQVEYDSEKLLHIIIQQVTTDLI